jgi:hypothetical protein
MDTRHCVLDCCVETYEELVKQACRLMDWRYERGRPFAMSSHEPRDEVHRFLEKPYETEIRLFIDWPAY